MSIVIKTSIDESSGIVLHRTELLRNLIVMEIWTVVYHFAMFRCLHVSQKGKSALYSIHFIHNMCRQTRRVSYTLTKSSFIGGGCVDMTNGCKCGKYDELYYFVLRIRVQKFCAFIPCQIPYR